MAEKLAVDSRVPREGASSWAASSWVQPRSSRALATLKATIFPDCRGGGSGAAHRAHGGLPAGASLARHRHRCLPVTWVGGSLRVPRMKFEQHRNIRITAIPLPATRGPTGRPRPRVLPGPRTFCAPPRRPVKQSVQGGPRRTSLRRLSRRLTETSDREPIPARRPSTTAPGGPGDSDEAPKVEGRRGRPRSRRPPEPSAPTPRAARPPSVP